MPLHSFDEIYTAECSRKITQGRVDGVLKDKVTESVGATRIFLDRCLSL